MNQLTNIGQPFGGDFDTTETQMCLSVPITMPRNATEQKRVVNHDSPMTIP